MRSTRAASSARLVITAEVCGRASKPRKVAPPLKSTRTKFSVSDEWARASPSTRVRSNSLLPEPVAPMSMPCGPIPSCADSLMSSSTGRPSAPTAMGTRSRLFWAARRSQNSCGECRCRSVMPSRVVSWMSVDSGCAISAVAPVRIGARSAARERAAAGPSRSARPSGIDVSLRLRSVRTIFTSSYAPLCAAPAGAVASVAPWGCSAASTSRRSTVRPGFQARPSATSSTTELRYPARSKRCPEGTWPPSRTTTT